MKKPISLAAFAFVTGLPLSPDPLPPFCPVENFQACGGSLQGSWSLEAQCPDASEAIPCEFPFDNIDACQGAGNTVQCHWDGTGQISFTKKTMHIQTQDALVARYTLTDLCTAAVRPDAGLPAERCAALSRPPLMSCTLEKDLCVCDSRVEDEPSVDKVTYTASSNVLNFADFQASYCIKDERLTLSFEPHPRSWKYWVLKKTQTSKR
ncbi:MAG TPA: hypothetical protein VE954_15210 [Oligoflexus sp.]|uniref:hypothetical protein n=1 Tax=Oligoflexus sp. TaxID=1971216 RepID=UPI002D46D6A5|nr:hypothetical protein [Oligoflexus sp.]HYX34452.1 hypothetical protein [Oligoflexus sp.]